MNLSDRVRANVRTMLEGKGLTYGELGWHRNYVSDVVNGVRGLSLARVEEFAARLHVDPIELLREPRQ